MLQALLLVGYAVASKNTLPEDASFRARRDLRSVAGFAVVIYAMLVYPVRGKWADHGWMAGPMFGVAPCPSTIFTIGMLLLARERWVLGLSVIPFFWSLFGLAAALQLGIPEDLGFRSRALFWQAFSAMMCCGMGLGMAQLALHPGRKFQTSLLAIHRLKNWVIA